MTTDKITFTERRAALESAGTRLRNAIADLQAACADIDTEANAMRIAEQRFAKRSERRTTRRHG